MVNHDHFARSLINLRRQIEHRERALLRPDLLDLDREALAESIVQRFEIAYDQAWKCLRRHLTSTLGFPDVPASPKGVFKFAAQSGILGALEEWLAYADLRTAVAHEYGLNKQGDVLDAAPRFVDDAAKLYSTITGSALP